MYAYGLPLRSGEKTASKTGTQTEAHKMKKIISLTITVILLLSTLFSFVSFANAELENGLQSEAYIVTDAATGQILYAKNHEKQETLSGITKVMTAAIALEKLELDANATATVSAVGNDVVPRDTINISLVEGETVDVKSLLHATLLAGANDAANVLAEAASGSIENFVKQMNEKATALGCKNTKFYNANGLTSDTAQNNVTTAYDYALIMKYAMENAYFKQIIKQTTYTIPETNKSAAREISTSYNLLKKNGFYEYSTGGAVGYSKASGYTAVSSALNGDKELICVVLNCPLGEARFADTQKLFDYIFDNFEYSTLTQDDIRSKTVDVLSEDGTQIIAKATLTLPGEIKVLLHKDIAKENLIITDTTPESFKEEAENQSVTITANSDLMFSPVATSYLQASTEILATPEPVTALSETAPESKNSFGSVVLTILKVIGIIILVIIAGVIVFAVYAVVSNNKRRKQRAERRRRERDGEPTDEEERNERPQRRGNTLARRNGRSSERRK